MRYGIALTCLLCSAACVENAGNSPDAGPADRGPDATIWDAAREAGPADATLTDAAVRDAAPDARIRPDMRPFVDVDRDGVADDVDNCPQSANPTQRDADDDGLGDACDVGDTDGDGLADRDDPCPTVLDPVADTDGDGFGDPCDVCPEVNNPQQTDSDGDGIGDVCEIPNDDDADGAPDDRDNCPQIANGAQADRDMDGVGDACDICPDDPDPRQLDSDSDGMGDGCDVCPIVALVAENHVDRDGDGFPTCANDCDDANPQRAAGLMEACDGIDNDCDLMVDEDFAGLGDACATGTGACRAVGVLACMPDGSVACDAVAGPPGVEACDAIDNDCDGMVDEALIGCCEPGDRVACGSDIGACMPGTQTCTPERAWGPCDDVGPAFELCNQIDDDCDGTTDEDLQPVPCGEGVCARMLPACVDGGPPMCDPLLGAGAEVCDGLDNDCDGSTDETVDFQADERNCGRCGRVCDDGVECIEGFCGGLFTFEGFMRDVPDEDLGGWEVCYREHYGARVTRVADVLADCDGEYVMYGCRALNMPNWQLLAMGERQEVFRDTGDRNNNLNEHNGVAWYFSQGTSIGFVQPGTGVMRNTCDTANVVPEHRLCWHTSGGTITGGYRCGERAGLNGAQDWERVIWTSRIGQP